MLFSELLKVLGWQGGTVHQVLREVKKLIDENKQLRKKLSEVKTCLR